MHQGAVDIKAFYKNRRHLPLLRHFKVNGNDNSSSALVIKMGEIRENTSGRTITSKEQIFSTTENTDNVMVPVQQEPTAFCAAPCSLIKHLRQAFTKKCNQNLWISMHAPYCNSWPVRFHNIFPASSHKRQDFRKKKKVIEHKMCFDFVYNFCLKHVSF